MYSKSVYNQNPSKRTTAGSSEFHQILSKMDGEDEKLDVEKVLNREGKRGGDGESGSTDGTFVDEGKEESDAHSIKREDLKPK